MNFTMRSYKTIIFLIIAGLCVGAGIYRAAGFISYGKSARPVKADAAIVLGAASYGDKPSPVFRERINHAIWLYRRGFVKKIIFTGARDSRNEPAASAVASRYAAGRGVATGDILCEDRSTTTQENLFGARQLAEKNGLTNFLIVSDPLHMKRSMMLAESLGMAVHPAPTPTTRYRGIGSRLAFLAREVYYYETYLLYRQAERLSPDKL
ncbi:MAG: YdcF family protein [Spirochaetes bacterium]|nr:YdcF family protein [Spirochaetota bacterium]